MAEQTVSTSAPIVNESEEWRPIPGYEGLYEASSLGRIRRVARWQYNAGQHERIWLREKILRPATQGGWAYYVSLMRDGKAATHTVHKLVLTTFVGPRPEGMEGSHLDGDARNCRPSNLVWETHAENIRRKAAHGTQDRGEQVGTSKLTEADVQEMKRLRASGLKHRELAQRFGVGGAQVSRILSGKRWRHLKAVDCTVTSTS